MVGFPVLMVAVKNGAKDGKGLPVQVVSIDRLAGMIMMLTWPNIIK
jgi:hypothetical protein